MVMSVGTQRLGFLTVNSGRQRGSVSGAGKLAHSEGLVVSPVSGGVDRKMDKAHAAVDCPLEGPA